MSILYTRKTWDILFFLFKCKGAFLFKRIFYVIYELSATYSVG